MHDRLLSDVEKARPLRSAGGRTSRGGSGGSGTEWRGEGGQLPEQAGGERPGRLTEGAVRDNPRCGAFRGEQHATAGVAHEANELACHLEGLVLVAEALELDAERVGCAPGMRQAI
ncbi:MAG: hypothetical protein ACM32J_16255, partial [Rhizobacter sp.]